MDFEVATEDLRTYRWHDGGTPELADGQVLLRTSSFALTANNVTYAAFGTAMGYWRFFPAEEGWGRVPVWGFADVEASRSDEVAEGERIYGYLPMSTHLVVEPARVRTGAFDDASDHRAALPPVYNSYQRVAGDPGYDPAREHEQALLRPLFTTSFLIDDWLGEGELFGARSVVLTSASSKTSLGLAHLLAAREGVEVVGLTSSGNADFVRGVGSYDRVVVYGELSAVPAEVPTVLVDMAGDAGVIAEVHRHFGDALTKSSRVGATHWEELRPPADLPGPAPEVFFAPDRIVARREQWGAGGLEQRIAEAWRGFLASADGWLTVSERIGPDAVAEAWIEVLEGRARPDRGEVLSLPG